MCQPKPGPRCSAHARTTLEARRAAKDEALAARDAAQAAVAASDRSDPDYLTLREAFSAANAAYGQANAAYATALREYETTPEGMAALEEAAQRFDRDHDSVAAEEVRERLAQARETRQRQVADLAMSRQFAARLDAPTAEEAAALAEANSDVAAHEARLAECVTARDQASARWEETRTEVVAADRAVDAANRVYEQTVAEAKEARDAVRAEAKRLYVEAGVSERFADFYATDMVTAAARPPAGRSYVREPEPDAVPKRPLTMKVKREGADRDKTLAAKAAAETDPGFQLANAHLSETLEHMEAARERLTEICAETDTARTDHNLALRAVSAATYAVEDATSARDRAVTKRDDLRARIGSGLGVGPSTTLDMSRVRDEIVRNPDGTTNAYVYNPPSDGFPYGRYVAAVDVTTVRGMGAANALVLENGQKAWLHGHYSRGVRGARENQTGYQHVVVVPAQEGARPLREEGVADAGFYTFVDTSD